MQPPRHNGKVIPANLRPYVEVLGVDEAVRFFLELGGSAIYLAGDHPQSGLAVQLVGPEKVKALCEAFDGANYVKVPLARRWTAEVLYGQGVSCAEIARRVRADVATVFRWFDARPTR